MDKKKIFLRLVVFILWLSGEAKRQKGEWDGELVALCIRGLASDEEHLSLAAAVVISLSVCAELSRLFSAKKDGQTDTRADGHAIMWQLTL